MTRPVYLFALLLSALLLSNYLFDFRPEPVVITGKVTSAPDGAPLQGVAVQVKGTRAGTATDAGGNYQLVVPDKGEVLLFTYVGYKRKEVKIGTRKEINVQLEPDKQVLEEVVVTGYENKVSIRGRVAGVAVAPAAQGKASVKFAPPVVKRDAEIAHFEQLPNQKFNTEEYDAVHDNPFLEVQKNPLSTFSIDVDKASYSNVRRFLNMGQRPPKDAVRIEELVNYFTYNYQQPQGKDPFSVTTELAPCPWNKENRLLLIGLQGKDIPTADLPASNLVFLIDVSGSMGMPEKLPLVKAGFKLLVDQLRPQDKVALVVYAGAAGLVLPATPGSQKEKIMQAIDNLNAGGSTAGGEGIKLAYQVAQQQFMKGGNNRVVLATDGDFNVGVSSNAELERLVEAKRETGVFLTVLGFGMGNYKDAKMEKLADKGNGNYAYVDNLLEAKKVFVNEFGGTLFTIAKDVKLQLEFNPAQVKAYRLIGYENRALRNEDFNNDKKDAGELGSGHTVTALYEVVPTGAKSNTLLNMVDDLKYQTAPATTASAAHSNEVLTLKLRYKQPDADKSSLLQAVVQNQVTAARNTSENFRFAAAVASFGMLLRESEHKGTATYASVLELAEGARGQDKEGYRIEFINMVKSMSLLSSGR